jgi:hypothetical protein
VANRDITEGRSSRAIAVDIGIVASNAIWQNTDIAYDVALNGVPFIYAINDNRPYIRQTAPFKKEQFDSHLLVGGFAANLLSIKALALNFMTQHLAKLFLTVLQIARA